MSDRPAFRSYSHANREYDPAFERHLVEAITETIARESRVDDLPVVCLRTGETIAALATLIAGMLALSPGMHVPSRLRETVDELGKRIRRDAARAKAQGVGDIFGGGQWSGHA